MANRSELTRIVVEENPELGDLYDSILDEAKTNNCLDLTQYHAAIHKTTLNKDQCQIGPADTLFEVCEGIGMPKQQQMSVALQRTAMEGWPSRELTIRNNSDSTVVALYYQHFTRMEQVNFMASSINFEAMQHATHMVRNIRFGWRAQLFVHIDGEDRVEATKQVMRKLANAHSFILGEDGTTEKDIEETGYKISFSSNFGMTTPGKDSLLAFAKALREMSSDNCVDERALCVTLTPISLIQSFFGMDDSQTVNELDSGDIEDVRLHLTSFDTKLVSLQLLEKICQQNCSVLSKDVVTSVGNMLRQSEEERDESLTVLWDSVKTIRSGGGIGTESIDFADLLLVDRLDDFLCGLGYVRLKPRDLKEFKRRGISIITDFDAFTDITSADEVFVLSAHMCSQNEDYEAAKRCLLNLSDRFQCAFVDLDLMDDVSGLGEAEQLGVRLYKNGICVMKNCCTFYDLLSRGSIVKNEGGFITEQKPIRRVMVSMACPKCMSLPTDWLCSECETQIEYGFDHRFYCECGSYSSEKATFFCSEPQHGTGFVSFDSEQSLDTALSGIPPCKEYNVLLLGETGCGKSTWINAMINYLSSSNLFDAAEHELRYVIPTSFSMEGDDKQVRTISVGSSEDEVFRSGESATQRPRSYTFNFGNHLMRFIDVPGIGDVRGAVKDRENFDSVLRFLETLPELHAICVLLLPNTSRLTVTLKYCLNELLSHLHTNATANLVFCFTKTRTTFYRAGESLNTLKTYLDERRLDIPLADDTMYYFDNEAFRLLCAEQNGIQFADDEKCSYAKSWEKSASETVRLLEHAIATPAHRMREMVSLHEMRRIIERLTPLLADYSTNIQRNIRLIDQNAEESKLLAGRGDELSNQLHLTQVTIERSDIAYPRTVCVSAKCVESRSVPGTDETLRYYKQICHSQCYLTGVEREEYPNPILQNCAAMSGSGQSATCHQCGCPWDVHMHIYYMQEEKAISVVDPVTENLLNENADRKCVLDAHLQSLELRKNDLLTQYKKLTKYCAAFGTYLQSNSIVIYNDAMIEYLDYSINVAKQDVPNGEISQRVERLEQFKKEYEEELKILKLSGEGERVSLAEVDTMKRELFAMQEIGGKMKAALERRTAMEDCEHSAVPETHQDIPLARFRTTDDTPLTSIHVSTDPSQLSLDELAFIIDSTWDN